MAASGERRAAFGASYNACASGATPCKFETRQPARPAGKATADRQFQRRVRPFLHDHCFPNAALGLAERIFSLPYELRVVHLVTRLPAHRAAREFLGKFDMSAPVDSSS